MDNVTFMYGDIHGGENSESLQEMRERIIFNLIPFFDGDDTEGIVAYAKKIEKYIVYG